MARLAGRRLWRRPGAWLTSILVVVSPPASAHGFGLRYDLPLPLMLWIIGAASTVLLSFLLVAIAVRLNPHMQAPVQLNLLRWQMGRVVTGQTIRFGARLLAVGALIVIVVAGIIGDQTAATIQTMAAPRIRLRRTLLRDGCFMEGRWLRRGAAIAAQQTRATSRASQKIRRDCVSPVCRRGVPSFPP